MNSNRVSKSITWKIGPGCLMNCARLFAAISCAILLDGSANAEDRPFKGRTQGQLAISPTEVPWIVTSVDSGTAIGTHVGPCTMVGYDVVDLSTFWVGGGFTWTTTNGDQLTGVYSGPMAFGRIARSNLVAAQSNDCERKWAASICNRRVRVLWTRNNRGL